jgi:DNA polymerase I-like protein with 3'-5' exonuclease and polymerase domains
MYVPRPGMAAFMEMDYCAFEAEILAALAGDRVLKVAIRNGLHNTNMELLGVDKTRAKNAFYGWSYGAGAKTLVETFRAKGFDVPFSECRKMLNAFDLKYQNAANWREHQISLSKTQHYVENPFGLRRYFYGSPGTAGANSPIQSTAAMIMWKVLPETGVAARAGGGLQVAMVHDSIEFEIPEGFLMTTIRDIMQQTFDCVEQGFWVPVETKVGSSWGSTEKILLPA